MNSVVELHRYGGADGGAESEAGLGWRAADVVELGGVSGRVGGDRADGEGSLSQ